MKNYMVGTKFYRYDNELIEIIRLKKVIREGVYLFDVGYRDVIISALEFINMIHSGRLKKTSKSSYNYFYQDIHGNQRIQTWEFKTSDQKESMHVFRVISCGIIISEDDLDVYYYKLIPDGFIVSGIIEYRMSVGGSVNKDILMTVHKDKDPKPSIICRQDISSPRDDGNRLKPILGGSIYLRKYPEMDYMSLLTYDAISHKKVIAFYAEDTVNSILHYMNPVHKYNVFLKQLYHRNDNFKHYDGLAQNMHEFLNKTYFYHDFAAMFGIGLYPLPLDLGGGEMTEKQETMFNALFSHGSTRYKNLKYQLYSREFDILDQDIFPIRDNCNGSEVGDLFVVTTQS